MGGVICCFGDRKSEDEMNLERKLFEDERDALEKKQSVSGMGKKLS